MRTRKRLVAAGVTAAVLAGTAGAVTAAASSSGASPSKTTSPTATPTGKTNPLAAVAGRLHVSIDQLQRTLGDVKTALGSTGGSPVTAATIALVERDLGVDATQARWLLTTIFGDRPAPGGTTRPHESAQSIIDALARALGISESRAATVAAQLQRLPNPDLTSDPGFAAIAASLHITPQALADAITRAKQSLSTGD